MFKSNLSLKVFSLIMAVVIWIQLNLNADHQSVVKIRTQFKNVPRNQSELHQVRSVPFNVRGRGMDILRLKLSRTVAVFDAEAYDKSVNLSALDYEIRNRPSSLNLDILGPIKDFDPDADNNASKTKEDKASANGREAFTQDEPGQGTDQQQSTRILENLAIRSNNGLIFTPSVATIKVQGTVEDLKKLPRGIRIVASEEQDAAGTYELSAELPEGVELLDITPRRVRQRK
ncbi:MAG TPA: hypothetical protein PK802_06585 [Candidatus Cloacimonadota bacterium]|jgi:hypothetical protein|nr:hypothetical protein [Candidatus Cloacimonadota bacterium]HOF59682.1 hypothetical protein [Candidatus Cloacimonadota bacterium]HOR58957.1 hypothetical protein [Candidatus Cloacimonadota bacterium]HPB09337.1 hypothetical protein [Candidatus Cloacimonadota bacterium]HPL23185.1 hypothetical protein [Candidatus Cloacimonadota bacterium]